MNMRIPLLAAVASLVLLAGCLPPALQDAIPDAAVVAVPANARIPGAAEGLQDRLERLDTGHDLVPRAATEFLEVRRGIVGASIAPAVARLARNVGADVAVTIGDVDFERELVGRPVAPRERVVLRLEVVLVRASDGAELARIRGHRSVRERFLPENELPPLREDPLVREMVDSALDRLAPRVAAELRSLAVSGSTF